MPTILITYIEKISIDEYITAVVEKYTTDSQPAKSTKSKLGLIYELFPNSNYTLASDNKSELVIQTRNPS